MTNPEVIAKLTALNVPFDEKAKPADLAKLLKKVEADIKKAEKEKAKAEALANAGEEVDTEGKKIVWLKNRAYINDTQRVEAGVYLLEEVPARFSKLKSDTLEVFEDEVPSRKLAVIARWAGINPDGIEDEEILARVISTELKPF